jgi:hypothetical protein
MKKEGQEITQITNLIFSNLHEGINFISYDAIRVAIRNKGIILPEAVEYCLDLIINEVEKQAPKRGVEVYFPNQIYIDVNRYRHAPVGCITLIVRNE